MLRVALPTGRMMKQAIPFLESAGYAPVESLIDTRKLTVRSQCGRVEYLLVKPVDTPLYIEQGVADVGVCGKDVLMEVGADLLEPLDLGISKCRMVVAGRPELERKLDNLLSPVRVASKFPRVAQHYFRKKGVPCTVFKLSGSVEIGAVLGLSHYIVDIVETGTTLRENGLVVHEEIADCSARLAVNRAAWYAKLAEVRDLLLNLKSAVEGAKS
ncbi:MAG: ATP phosphoribosyltransferase [Planctomycetes bacterium]|nr:ATP phosphoribosyltransferase [Planctomycetota bacterium]MCA8945666.1 ATP phosphoribosyltransferase [Planctomycetota bacterium]